MLRKGFVAVVGGFVGRKWLAAVKLLLEFDVFDFFQGFQMRGEVTVGELQQFFQFVKTQGIVDHEHGHKPKPDLAFKYLVKLF